MIGSMVAPHRAMCLLAEFAIGRILTRVRLFVVEVLDESIVSSSKRTTKERADPVDPVVARERCASDGRTEASCGIEGTAGVVNT
jgi:hypothetical protein